MAFDPPSLHFLFSKSSIFLTTYPSLNANVICEGSLMGTTANFENIPETEKKHSNEMDSQNKRISQIFT